MDRLITEMWNCVKKYEFWEEKIKEIRLHPTTLYKLMGRYIDAFALEKGINGYGQRLWGYPVIVDKDVVENSYWVVIQNEEKEKG